MHRNLKLLSILSTLVAKMNVALIKSPIGWRVSAIGFGRLWERDKIPVDGGKPSDLERSHHFRTSIVLGLRQLCSLQV